MSATVSTVSPPALRAPLRLALFAVLALGAAYCGFLQFSVDASRLILRQGGYYLILASFVLWLGCLWRSRDLWVPLRPASRREWLAAGGSVALFLLVALTHETFRSKILYDEFVLQSTAYNLHFFRDNSAIVRGYDLAGVFVSLDSYVDKRPVFFPFLVSLAHDLTGYRPANVFAVNAVLFAIVLAVGYALGRWLNGWRGGLLLVALLGSLPLLAQNASGAGMELLNLTMLLVVIVLAAAWLQQPDERRLSAFVLGVVLLVQSRYESALYVAPAAAAILAGWWRARRVVLSWPAMLAPWLLLPVALQQKVISNSPVMWELHGDQTTRFSTTYLAGNLQAAWTFFTAEGLAYANSRFLALLGALAVVLLLVRAVRERRTLGEFHPLRLSLLLFGAGILAALVLVMFYYWSALNDPMASRFALPFCALLAILVVAAAAWADRRLPASLVLLAATGAFTIAVSSPKQSYHFYSHLGTDEIEWERRVVAARPGTKLILSNKSTLPWMIDRTPAILLERARAVADRIADQLHGPDFSEILVTQSSRPTSVEGQYELVPEEKLPDWFQLELIAERRFGTKLARISRVVSINLPADFHPSNPPLPEHDTGLSERPGQ